MQTHNKTKVDKMATILQAVQNIVEFADVEYLEECGYEESNLYKIYMSEYGQNGFNQNAVTEYIKGLPTIVDFPSYNGDILFALEDHGITRKSHIGQGRLIEQYWETLGYVVFKNLEKEKKKLDT